MVKDFISYLKKYGNFGRSYSRSELASDKSIRLAYQNALNNGIGKCNRLRTVIVGDKGVGKTSTLQMLTGSKCDPTIEPHSTEVIDITTCETSDLTPEWSKVSGNLRADDPRLAASWCVCKDEDSFRRALKINVKPASLNTKIQRNRRTLKQHKHLQEERGEQQAKSYFTDSGDLLKLTILITLTTSVYTGLGYEFGPFAWLTVFAYCSSFRNFNRAYRFGTGFALHAIVVDILCSNMILDIQIGENANIVMGSLKVLLCCFLSGLFGLLIGSGCRIGTVIAFCLMTRPKSLPVDDEDWQRKAPHIILLWSGFLVAGIFVKQSGSFVKSGIYWLLHKKLLRIGGCFTFFLLMFILLNGRYVYSLFIGCASAVNYIIGIHFARELTAKKISRDGYLKKKGFGFIAAFILGHLFGFKLNTCIGLIQVTCIASFILRDLYICFQVQRALKDGIPIHTFREQILVSMRGQDATVMKLIVWDFAGDSIYRVMQQFFLPEKAIYILVFSLETAWENPRQQMERLKQWLYTIKAHSTTYDSLVFIVGTHRDSVCNHVGFLDDIAEELRESLYNDFCGILAINTKYESPLFVVENSRHIDEDGVLLRETIKRNAKERPFLKQEQPVWYLRLLDIMKQWKDISAHRWYIERETFLEIASREGFAEEEVERFLKFCHFSGEFIYRNDDKVMKNYVILDPQHLLDIMKEVLKFPSLSERLFENAANWQALQTNGVASVDLLTEIVDSDREVVDTVTRFLEAYNMLLPIQPANGNSFTHCIVPSCLPELPEGYCVWDSADDDEEYFFDFGYVPAEAIFHRILARCWYHHQEIGRTSSGLYHQCGIFCFKEDSIFFMLQLLKNSTKQQLIKVVVQSLDAQQRCGFQVLQWITGELEDIRRKDFPNLPYKLGPCCNICCEGQDTIKVLELCVNGEEFPAANGPVKKLLADGRYHEVCLAPKLSVVCGRKNRRSYMESSRLLSATATEETPEALQGAVSIGEGSKNVVIKAGDNTTINLHNPRTEHPAD
ncbi:uncharacterized protein [Amphiura filiformis]|uniref:uncharacterized protein n=1 Tax=Amphiura filiformis TaxID=82378 RepID=UPI003B220431